MVGPVPVVGPVVGWCRVRSGFRRVGEAGTPEVAEFCAAELGVLLGIGWVAAENQVAELLGLEGDTDPVEVRRSKAVGVRANPARAFALLARHSTDPDPDTGDPDPDPDTGDTDPDPGTGDTDTDPGESDTDTGAGAGEDTGGSTGGGDTAGGTSPPGEGPPDPPADRPGRSGGGGGGGACPFCTGGRVPAGDLRAARDAATGFVRRAEVDLDRLRPRATRYVHISAEALTHPDQGVARVDGYEVPARMREVMALRSPTEVFCWAPGTSRSLDLDHVTGYRPPDRGGPPGQTHPDRLAGSVAAPTDSRPTAAGGSANPNPASTSGVPRTGTCSWSTTPAPTGSATPPPRTPCGTSPPPTPPPTPTPDTTAARGTGVPTAEQTTSPTAMVIELHHNDTRIDHRRTHHHTA